MTWQGIGVEVFCLECCVRHLPCMAQHTQIRHIDYPRGETPYGAKLPGGHVRTVITQNCMRPEGHKGIHHTRCECAAEVAKPNPKVQIGQRFGRLTIMWDLGTDAHRSRYWLCRCDCGGSKRTRQDALRSGRTASCGCLQDEARRKAVGV